MKNERPCPVCGGTCSVSADGKTGYCNRDKRRWKIRNVLVSALKPGPIRHECLTQPLLEIARWTYQVVGRFIHPTFEQWELGFLRDMHPASELAIWARASNAYTTFLKAKGRDPKAVTQEEGRLIVGVLLSSDASPVPSEFIEKTKDESVRKKLIELSRPECIQELRDVYLNCDQKLPGEFIVSVTDESVREMLRELNRQVKTKPAE